jgi:hypothetical protein
VRIKNNFVTSRKKNQSEKMVFASFSYYMVARFVLGGPFVVLRSAIMARYGVPFYYGYDSGSLTLTYTSLSVTGTTVLLDFSG